MNNRILWQSVGFLCSLLFAAPVFSGTLDSPIGRWLTFDEKTHQARSIVAISKSASGLNGKIVKIYFKPGESAQDRCEKCQGDLHNQLILGLTILRNMKQDKLNTWQAGEIVDPENGKSYRCLLTLQDAGKSLKVRGYIGLPLLGRSQIWQRLVQGKSA